MTTATTTCDIVGSSTVCLTDTTQNFIGGFSYGEVITIMLLLMIFTLLFFAKIKEWIFGVKVNNYQIKIK
jgi:hypothetical protein